MDKNLVPNLSQDINIAQSWIQKHERILIVFAVLVAGYFLLDKGLNVVLAWDQHKASVAMATLNAQKEKTDAELEQAKQMLTSYETQLTQLSQQNVQLSKTIAQRNSDLAKEQVKVPTLQPTELAQMWASSIVVDSKDIAPTPDGYNVTPKAAIATVQALNTGATAVQNLQDEENKNVNLQKEVDSGNALISQGKIAVNGLQLELKDQEKSCETQLTVVKAEARKGKLKSFGIGFVTGFISGQVAKFFGF